MNFPCASSTFAGAFDMRTGAACHSMTGMGTLPVTSPALSSPAWSQNYGTRRMPFRTCSLRRNSSRPRWAAWVSTVGAPPRFAAALPTGLFHLLASKGKNMNKILIALAAILTLSTGPSVAGVEDDVKASFDRFVVAQNAHDVSAVSDSLLDSPSFLWVTRGAPIWGREAALKRFETLYQGTWKLSPDTPNLKVVVLSDTTAQLYVPVTFNIGPAGQPASDAQFLMNQTLVKTSAGWRIASILPIPLPSPASAPAK